MKESGGVVYLYRRYRMGGGIDRLELGTLEDPRTRHYLTEARSVIGHTLEELSGVLEQRGYLRWGDDVRMAEVRDRSDRSSRSRRTDLETGIGQVSNFDLRGGQLIFRGKVLGRKQG